ncbi:unnamed protein product [Rotaria socialis]|uniref:ADP ribosyltransferase domain-containing protein n=1 Tax=Rotaria socialis TaxID=392032 RepID=A0A820PMU7_9BILA|nr:unnamed protein product [Rotaria socialis]CAF3341709.1 unnamed protein product [Rotaria socialis]CAF3389473.1 unnamed protein product [Rotaria socialis]CAF3471743.1 unnamed protein product [Rotaria socialis]CAF3687426.1 unnamed protein product [Rotaria socialis]
MATANSTTSSTRTENYETFSLLWLDGQVNATEENKRAQTRLRSIINYLKLFENPQECRQYIKNCSEQDRIVLIISGRLSKELIPQIHELRQLSSVYIYCRRKKEYKTWAKEFPKIKHIVVQLDDLVQRIKEDQRDLGKTEDPISMNIYNAASNPDKSTTELNGSFIHNLLLIDVLVRMPSLETDKHRFVKSCKEDYSGNEQMLRIIREFDNDYKPRKALWWYTRDIFIFNMLNKALRIQNTDRLLLFHFIIRDIYELIKENQCRKPIKVYRYQRMSADELRNLQRSIGQYISINSFFSTSSNRDTAMKFSTLSAASNDLHRILYIIDADPRAVKSKPFADISSLSYFPSENEILFMIGCIFRLVSIHRDDIENIWIVKMELAGDDNNDLKSLFYHLKKDYAGEEAEAGMQSVGNVLYYMGQYDQAEKIYSRLRERCSTDDTSYPYLCFSLAMLYKDRKDYARSLKWLETALERKFRAPSIDNIYIAGLYCSIGNIHLEKKDYKKAMKFYNQSGDFYKRENALDHPDVSSLYHGIARMYYYQNQYSEAFHNFQRSLNIQQKYLPANHPDVAITYSSIGDVFQHAGQYPRAMENYTRSLEIRKRSLHPQHPEIAAIHKIIAQLYEAMSKYKEALYHYEKASNIYFPSLSNKHPTVIELKSDIQRVTSKLK